MITQIKHKNQIFDLHILDLPTCNFQLSFYPIKGLYFLGPSRSTCCAGVVNWLFVNLEGKDIGLDWYSTTTGADIFEQSKTSA